jgi:hypothetical protein
MTLPTSLYSIYKLIEQAIQLATDFKKTTGKLLLGVSNGISEHDAAKFLGLELGENRSQGFDAKRVLVDGPEKVQIKARAIFNDNYRGQRLDQLKLDKPRDSVALVLLDENYQAFEISEAKRGAMSVAKFRNIAKLVWTKEDDLDKAAWQE